MPPPTASEVTKWHTVRNQHPNCDGSPWGWVEGLPGHPTWSGSDAEKRWAAICEEHNHTTTLRQELAAAERAALDFKQMAEEYCGQVRTLEGKLAQVQAERDEWRQDAKTAADETCCEDEKHCTCVSVLRTTVKHLTTANARLREDLRKYGRHTGFGIRYGGCNFGKATYSGLCTCGLTAALTGEET